MTFGSYLLSFYWQTFWRFFLRFPYVVKHEFRQRVCTSEKNISLNFQLMRSIWTIALVFSAAVAGAQEKRIDARKLYEQGEEAFNKAQYNDALALFNRCLQENPGYAEAYFTRAATREQLKDLQGAHTDYNIFLELKPNHSEALYSLATLQYRLGMFTQ